MIDPRITAVSMYFDSEVSKSMKETYGFDPIEAIKLHLLSYSNELKIGDNIIDISVEKVGTQDNNSVYKMVFKKETILRVE